MPYSRQAAYYHHRQRDPSLFVKGTFRTVPLSHTSYSGTKYASGVTEAVVGKLKGGGWTIQSILERKKQTGRY